MKIYVYGCGLHSDPATPSLVVYCRYIMHTATPSSTRKHHQPFTPDSRGGPQSVDNEMASCVRPQRRPEVC